MGLHRAVYAYYNSKGYCPFHPPSTPTPLNPRENENMAFMPVKLQWGWAYSRRSRLTGGSIWTHPAAWCVAFSLGTLKGHTLEPQGAPTPRRLPPAALLIMATFCVWHGKFQDEMVCYQCGDEGGEQPGIQIRPGHAPGPRRCPPSNGHTQEGGRHRGFEGALPLRKSFPFPALCSATNIVDQLIRGGQDSRAGRPGSRWMSW